MPKIGINVGISAGDGKKYDVEEALIDWYAERLNYMYGGENRMMNSSKGHA